MVTGQGGMWVPGQKMSRDIIRFFVACLNDDEVKAELHKQVRTEIDRSRNYQGSVQSYESLTTGNVNMQAKMAASGWDVYGRTYLKANKDTTNQNVYKRMKNKIKYGRAPQTGYTNRGSFRTV